ncbi:DUF4867 family protein [Bacillus sp. MRMR6]|uniref:DUF4867 family protein n=1 Tax=Bacillus sp. MRMR6 TaxID=1928617 RepID=UPI0009530100|nr:DUF4867 family protein [Bacillus sp. MRMR6]OLS35445.1 DUF4867 domain-containing protein [Bacillus sp. MRMR6]
MQNFDVLKTLNTHISFFHVNQQEFVPYGKILYNHDFNELQSYMMKTNIPEEGNIYVPSVTEMEETKIKEQVQSNFYGHLPIQIGYCNGRNSTLNGLEYHKGSEINIALTDLVLLLGKVQDIKSNSYDSQMIRAFYIPKGTAIELYGTTLHFAPCKVTDEGFKVIVILPAGTNRPLNKEIEKRTEEDTLLFMTNKWLLAHPEREMLISRGAYPGIKGENIQVFYH